MPAAMLGFFLGLLVISSGFPASLRLERGFPRNDWVEISKLRARDMARHGRILKSSDDHIIDFPVQGTYDPYLVGFVLFLLFFLDFFVILLMHVTINYVISDCSTFICFIYCRLQKFIQFLKMTCKLLSSWIYVLFLLFVLMSSSCRLALICLEILFFTNMQVCSFIGFILPEFSWVLPQKNSMCR